MKSVLSVLPTYDISEVNTATSTAATGNELFVFQRKEFYSEEKQFHPFRSSHFHLYLHRSGELEVKIDLVHYKVTQPCLFVVRPHCIREKLHESSGADSTILGFTYDFLGKSLMNKRHIDAMEFFSKKITPPFLLTDLEVDTMHTLMLLLKQQNNYDAHPYKEAMIQHAFGLLMLEMASLSKKYSVEPTQNVNRKDDMLFRFLKLLTLHFKAERSIRFYAKALYITPKHLTKTQKEITTKESGDIIDEMGSAEAKSLLDDLTYSVGQVADALHFSDQFFFYKFFKKHTGVCPKDYKKTA